MTKGPVVPTLTDEHRRMIKDCEKSGMRKRFEEVLAGMMNGRMPKDVDMYFGRVVSESESITVARQVYNYWQSKFGSDVRFRRAYGIVMITVGGRIQHILPARDLHQGIGGFRFSSSGTIIPSSGRLFAQAMHGQRNTRLIT